MTFGEDPPVTLSGGAILAPASPADAASLLRADGLGAVRFGEESEAAEVSLVAQFGPPSSVWEYSAAGQDDPACHLAVGHGCEEYFRSLSWESIGLSVVLIDVSPYRDARVPHFAGWAFWGAPAGDHLTTPDGVGIGTTIAGLEAAYGAALELSPWLDACAIEETWEFAADGIRGTLTGPPAASTTSVKALSAGVESSC